MKKLHILLFLLLFGIYRPSAVQAQYTIGGTPIDTTMILNGIDIPWEILWGPDNWIWMTERYGRVSRVNPETKQQQVLAVISDVYQQSESGLLGMVLHPDFIDTPYVYLVYTYLSGGSIREKLVRYTYTGTAITNPVNLITNIPGASTHNGSRLIITPDRKILMTTGDAQNQSSSQSLSSLNGKLLRINLDGTVPSDNPISGSYVYTWGHRNAQGLAYGPHSLLYSSEHGPSTDDELNIIYPNRNYGWPNVNGYCNTSSEITFCNANNVVEPILAWTPTIAPSDLIWYNHPAIPAWQNSLLMTVLKDKRIVSIKLDSTGTQVVSETHFFINTFRRLRDICAAPDGRIFIATNGDNWSNTAPFTHSIIELKNPNYQPVCSAPPSVFSDRILPTSARLNWSKVTGVNHYVIRGQVSGNPNYVYLNVNNPNDTSLIVSGLVNGVSYAWQIQGYCDANETIGTGWSNLDVFVCACMAPNSQWTTGLTQTSAILNWNRVAGTAGYAIRGKVAGSATWTNLLVGGNANTTKQVFGLQPGLTYEWQIRTWCDSQGNLKSAWTPSSFFTTLSPKLDAAIQEKERIQFRTFPNPAKDLLFLHITGLNKENPNALVTIFDLTGKQIIQNLCGESWDLNVSNFPPGTYLVQVEIGGQVLTQKVQVQ